MAGADYWQCPICGKKALYDHSDGYSEPPDVEVLHTQCLAKLRTDAEALLADAEKFVLNTGDWEYQPSELQIAEWVLRYREWAGLLLPNVTEVVAIEARRWPDQAELEINE